jgi:hypothetical protein
MPLQNRVRPDGEIVADPARGLMMGNRGGRLHDDSRQLGTRRWVSRAWICCRLRFNDRHRQVMGRGYTELFFLDEATALAAGHRPCFECRRADATRFAELWNRAQGLAGRAKAADMDRVLHRQRLSENGTRYHRARLDALPDAVMVSDGTHILLWHCGLFWPWSLTGYGPPARPPRRGPYSVLTPPAIQVVLGAGYEPMLHRSAGQGLADDGGGA